MSLASFSREGIHVIMRYVDLESLVRLYVTFDRRLQRSMSSAGALPYLRIRPITMIPKAPIKYFLSNIKSPRHIEFEKDVRWSAFTLPLLTALAPEFLTLNAGFLHFSTYRLLSDAESSGDRQLKAAASNFTKLARYAILNVSSVLPRLQSLTILCELNQIVEESPNHTPGFQEAWGSFQRVDAFHHGLPKSLTALSYIDNMHHLLEDSQVTRLASYRPPSLTRLKMDLACTRESLLPIFTHCPHLEQLDIVDPTAYSLFHPSKSQNQALEGHASDINFGRTLPFPTHLTCMSFHFGECTPGRAYFDALDLTSSRITSFTVNVTSHNVVADSLDFGLLLPVSVTSLTVKGHDACRRVTGLPSGLTELNWTCSPWDCDCNVMAMVNSLKALKKLEMVLHDSKGPEDAMICIRQSAHLLPSSLTSLHASLTLSQINAVMAHLPDCIVYSTENVSLWAKDTSDVLLSDPELASAVQPVFNLYGLAVALNAKYRSRAFFNLGAAYYKLPASYRSSIEFVALASDFERIEKKKRGGLTSDGELIEASQKQTFGDFVLAGSIQLCPWNPGRIIGYGVRRKMFPLLERIDINFPGGWTMTESLPEHLTVLDLHHSDIRDGLSWHIFPASLTRITSYSPATLYDSTKSGNFLLQHFDAPKWSINITSNLTGLFNTDMTAFRVNEIEGIYDYHVIPFLQAFSPKTLLNASMSFSVTLTGAIFPRQGDSTKTLNSVSLAARTLEILRSQVESFELDIKPVHAGLDTQNVLHDDLGAASGANLPVATHKIVNGLAVRNAYDAKLGNEVAFLSFPIYEGLEEVDLVGSTRWAWIGEMPPAHLSSLHERPTLNIGSSPHFSPSGVDIEYPLALGSTLRTLKLTKLNLNAFVFPSSWPSSLKLLTVISEHPLDHCRFEALPPSLETLHLASEARGSAASQLPFSLRLLPQSLQSLTILSKEDWTLHPQDLIATEAYDLPSFDYARFYGIRGKSYNKLYRLLPLEKVPTLIVEAKVVRTPNASLDPSAKDVPT